jgi:hypothetical protein
LRGEIRPDEAEPAGCGGSTVKGGNEVWPDFSVHTITGTLAVCGIAMPETQQLESAIMAEIQIQQDGVRQRVDTLQSFFQKTVEPRRSRNAPRR